MNYILSLENAEKIIVINDTTKRMANTNFKFWTTNRKSTKQRTHIIILNDATNQYIQSIRKALFNTYTVVKYSDLAKEVSDIKKSGRHTSVGPRKGLIARTIAYNGHSSREALDVDLDDLEQYVYVEEFDRNNQYVHKLLSMRDILDIRNCLDGVAHVLLATPSKIKRMKKLGIKHIDERVKESIDSNEIQEYIQDYNKFSSIRSIRNNSSPFFSNEDVVEHIWNSKIRTAFKNHKKIKSYKEISSIIKNVEFSYPLDISFHPKSPLNYFDDIGDVVVYLETLGYNTKNDMEFKDKVETIITNFEDEYPLIKFFPSEPTKTEEDHIDFYINTINKGLL